MDEQVPAVQDAGCEVVICAPYTDLATAVGKTKGTNIHVGAENCHFETTALIPARSPRRCSRIWAWSTSSLATLSAASISRDRLHRQQRRSGRSGGRAEGHRLRGREPGAAGEGVTEELVPMQTKIALRGVTAEQMANVVIAYEPIWAIGTGKTATADQAEEVCGQIRKVIGELYGEAVAEALTIQYGGSMNAKNAEELL